MASIKDGDSDSKRSSTSSEEMLSTPKLLPDSAPHFSRMTSMALLSPAAALRGMSPNAGLLSAAALTAGSQLSVTSGFPGESTNNNIGSNDGDMLTTPVVTTPRTSDQIWMSHTPPHLKLNFEGTSPDPR